MIGITSRLFRRRPHPSPWFPRPFHYYAYSLDVSLLFSLSSNDFFSEQRDLLVVFVVESSFLLLLLLLLGDASFGPPPSPWPRPCLSLSSLC